MSECAVSIKGLIKRYGSITAIKFSFYTAEVIKPVKFP